MDPKTKKGCLWAALGAVVLVIIVGVALVGGAAWFFYSNFSIQSEPATAESAATDLDALRARFGGQEPMLEITDDGSVARQRGAAPDAEAASLQWLHVAAYDPDDGRIARVKLPFWLLRLSPGGRNVSIGDDALGDLRGTRVTMQDLEGAGRGLILDHRQPDGSRVIIWTE